MIKNQHDCSAKGLDKIATVWREYWINLFADPNVITQNMEDYEEEPNILLEEVQVAIGKQ